MNHKKITLFFVCIFTASFLFADPCEGYWISYHITKKYPQGGWHVYVGENGKLYGDMIALSETPAEEAVAIGFKGKTIKDYPIEVDCDFSEFSTIGHPWMINLEKKSEGVWENGKILDASNGSIYQCRCFFHEADGKKYKVDTLEVKGELVKGIGGTIYWERATREEVLAIQSTHLLKKK